MSRGRIKHYIRASAVGLTRALGTGWLVVGAVLLTALLLEGAYRIQGAIRGLNSTVPTHPNANEPWWPAWEAAVGQVNGPSRYDPYRGWWPRPFESRWVHVDSTGARQTVPAPAAPVRARVLFLGGSVMWGYTTPDSLTIPSYVARQLHASGINDIELSNLAQPAFNISQGLITLLLRLQDGQRPDLVISLDGNNDVLAAVREGRPGAIIGEGDLSRRSALGWRGLGANMLGLLRYSALVRRLVSLSPAGGAAVPSCDAIGSRVAWAIAEGKAIGDGFDVRTVYLWQPSPFTTSKPKTEWERRIADDRPFSGLMPACAAVVDSLERGSRNYLSLSRLFDHDSNTVFLDAYGHLTPHGNEQVARRITELVVQQLGAGSPSAR